MAKNSLRNKSYGYFKAQHGVYEYRRGWFRAPVCPFCGREEKFSINLLQDRAKCFRCGYDDKIINAVIDIENLKDFKAAVTLLQGFEDAEYVEPRYLKIEERPVVLPEGFRTLRFGDSMISNMARNYVRSRGFDVKTLSRKGVGYTEDAESKYYGYLIVPFHRNREVIYFQTRRFFGVGPKFNNPMYEDFGIGKNQIIYNSDALSRHSEISMVESWTNAWTLGNSTVSLNGKTLSPKQLSLILYSKANLFNIILDRDAWEYALTMGFSLIQYKNIRIIEFEDDRDVNDLGLKVVTRMIDESPVISSFKDLVKRKHEMIKRYAEDSSI